MRQYIKSRQHMFGSANTAGCVGVFVTIEAAESNNFIMFINWRYLIVKLWKVNFGELS